MKPCDYTVILLLFTILSIQIYSLVKSSETFSKTTSTITQQAEGATLHY